MINITFLSALIFPVIFLLDLPPTTVQIVSGIGFAVASLTTSLIIFVPKMWTIWHGEDLTPSLKIGKVAGSKISPEIHKTSGTVNTGSTLSPSTSNRVTDTDYVDKSLKGLPTEAKVKLCVEQVNRWQAALLKIANESSNPNSVKSSEANVDHHLVHIQSRLNSVVESPVEEE